MDYSLTIIFILLSASIAVLLRRVKRDKCLKSYENNFVIIEKIDGELLKGKITLENTGIEIILDSDSDLDSGLDSETILTRLLYKHEYPQVFSIIRDPKIQNSDIKKKIEKESKKIKTHEKTFFIGRKMINIIRTLKNSIMEIVNLLISQVKKTAPSGNIINTQNKHINKIKAELADTVNNSFEPLLEKYIGKSVLIESLRNNSIIKISGILIDYTANFIKISKSQYLKFAKIDLILNRKYSVIRSLLK